MKTRIAVLLLLGALGCRHDEPNARVVAEIYGPDSKKPVAVLDEASFRMASAAMRFHREDSLDAAPLPSVLKERLLERIIEEKILLAEAARTNVSSSTTAISKAFAQVETDSSTTEVARRLSATYQTREDLEGRLRDRIQIGRLMARDAHAGVQVSDDEVKAAFDAVPEGERQVKARAKARHIIVRTEEEGRQILAELKKIPFDQEARAHSIGPEGASGGSLGWFESGAMPAVFETVFTLKPGEVSQLVTSEYGFHLFLLEAIEPARALSFEEMAPPLRAKLLRKKYEEAELAYVASVKKKYRVVRHDAVLAEIE